MSFNTTGPSHPLVSQDDHGSLLNVIAFFLAITSSLVVLTRLGTKWGMSRGFGLDDGLIVISTSFAIGQTICLSLMVANGLGRSDISTISRSQLVALQKSLYSFNTLFVMSQCFAKISIVILIRNITPVPLHRRLSLSVLVVIFLWTATAMLGFLFQCLPPQPWNFLGRKCISRVAFYVYVEILNMIIDCALVYLPVAISWNLQLERKAKAVVITCFLSRTLVVAALIVQLILIYHPVTTSEAFLSWPFFISTEIIQCLGIVTACVPYLKPFLEGLESGMIRNDDLRRRTRDPTKIFRPSTSKKLFQSRTTQSSASSAPGHNNGTFIALRDMPSTNLSQGQSRAFVSSERNERGNVEWDQNSQSSRANFIRQTTTYGVSTADVEVA